MAIRIVLEGGSRAVPKLFCDHCGEPIEKAGGGLYLWDHRPENEAFYRGEPVEVFMVHKGACDRGLCADRGWNRHDPATMEISVLPVYLGRSLGLNWEKAGELADDMGAV